jgi:tRNA(His) 5'-end guanylyltransferase
MAHYSDFDKRMKRYEQVTDTYLMRRTPVICRLDGEHFRTYTKGMKKPFDDIFRKSMQDTMMALCKEIPGCVFGYTQSDEITLVLVDYQTLETEAWFDYRISKLIASTASKAARLFNKFFVDNTTQMADEETFKRYAKKFHKADFDSRVFNVPMWDVVNNVLWRQKDAAKNSVATVAQSLYSQKELNGIKSKDLKVKMLTEKGVDWDSLAPEYKWGTACRRVDGKWSIDYEMPMLSDDRDYLEKLIHFD